MQSSSRPPRILPTRRWAAVGAALALLVGCQQAPLQLGSLEVTVTGLPPGVDANVIVVHGQGVAAVVTGTTVLSLPIGTYQIVPLATTTYGHWSTDRTTVELEADQVEAVAIAYRTTYVASYVDLTHGSDALVPAIDATDVIHSFMPDMDDMIGALAELEFDVYIVFQQTNPVTESLREALETAIAAGARIVFTTWKHDFTQHPADAWDLFGVEEVTPAEAAELTFLPPLRSGLPADVAVARPDTDPTWFTYAVGLEPSPGSDVLCVNDLGQACAVRANAGRTIALGFLSDVFVTQAQGEQLYRNVLDAMLR